MKRILKYLKPYSLFVLLIIALTFIQVQTELALPDYMSSIVSNGIQYAGIEEEIPEIITNEDLEKLSLFMNDNEYNKIISNYSLIDKNKEVKVKNQIIKFKQNVYILNKDYDKNIESILLKPLVFNYLASTSNLEINENNINNILPILEKESASLIDNYGSMARLYIGNIYKDVGLNTTRIQTNYILSTGLVMLGISLISVLVQILSTYLSTRISARVAANMRHDVFSKVESFSSTEFSKFSTSSLITRTTNDITKIQELIQMMLRMMLMAPMMGLTAVVKVTRFPGISWLLLVAIGIILATLTVLLIVAVPKFEIIQKLVDKINSITREFLDGILVIRAFNSEKYEEKRFDDINSEAKRIDLFVSRCMQIIGPIMTITMNGLTIAITWFSAKLIDIDVMTIGEMMAFSQYAMHVVISFMFVTMTFFMVPRSLVSMKRISEVLDTENMILDKEETLKLPEDNGTLEFKNVSFKYPGAEEYVLKNISFKAEPGESIAFIGSTGSGKSTVVKLIPRLFDVSEGEILYCGIDIRDLKQSELHEKIGFASQRAILFSGDIKSNIEFGRQVSEAELNEAIRISQSTNIIEEKEGGLNSTITQGGTNVSGGQKQRLSIARTLAKKENIYIFDDTFSALDYETDKKLRSELNELIKKNQATVFIVAQRISTIKNCDKIIVLDEGNVVGEGKHFDLLNNCKIYKEIATSQLSEEELNYASN